MVISYLGRGIAHERSGEACQDAIGGCRTDHGDWIIVLSDGAGEARYATEAAQLTVEAATDYLYQYTMEELTAHLLQHTQALLEACTAKLRNMQCQLCEPDLQHFSATLIFAVIGREQILIGHLGDGMAVVLNDTGQTVLYSRPEQGAGGGNTTFFTVSPEAPEKLRSYVIDRSKARADLLALTSDGPLEMFAGRGGGDPVNTVRELWDYAHNIGLNSTRNLADVLDQMAEITIERMDDWSVVVWCTAEGEEMLPVNQVPCSMLEEEERKYRASSY